MKRVSKLSLPKVTICLPMRNASSTVVKALESIRIQKYSIHEVILVDNASTDQSVDLVRKYAKKYKDIKIRVLLNKKDLMVARSFNRAIKAAKTPYVVLMHSDCCFASKNELRVLIDPCLRDSSVIATYGLIENPASVWERYSFWEKCLLARDVGKSVPGLVGKIDCYRRDILLQIGAFDDVGYADIGGEDADLHIRLEKVGKIVATSAKSLHLHYLYKDFSLIDLIKKRKRIAQTYGRLIRIRGLEYGLLGIVSHLTKPILAVGSLILGIYPFFILLIVAFIFLYHKRMFTTLSTLTDPQIILLPFVSFFLIYYETFWIIESFLLKVERRKVFA